MASLELRDTKGGRFSKAGGEEELVLESPGTLIGLLATPWLV